MDEEALIRRRIETWDRAGPELEALTDEDVRRYIEQIHSMPLPADLPPRTDSGLVEQQRWFAKLHPALKRVK